ncbi:darobactin export ABC transporter periplasmic adaptor subunit [Photorhabdus heterorhabditis]|uniref:HlyD family efflux transporter periplasmic adaptor subunit n=1 Tax=Photorhabdus heterorhabditis TaxID=880156 RepID=A0A5B0WLN0_9GAMM|nr:darobactin export ABC transporter periplasmic adaptor subunit [Photorhabdus heterorhabditis]KAA1187308.1 HlyD family efflux transporter periplasmic adaptor subunit [Photorhabdus heterorhabditis]MBS9443496.1 HlyD family efflux transporter periplasmic adaptor subunit [Photorhabdus heterorhabditis]
MDIEIRKKGTHNKEKLLILIFFIAFISFVVFIAYYVISSKEASVNGNEVKKFRISSKIDSDILKTRAVVVPNKSVSISTEIGGIVTDIMKKPSQNVLKGEEIVKLSNFNFTLNNSAMLADVTDKLNNLINIRINLQSDYRDINNRFLEASKELKETEDKLRRYNNLVNKNYVSKETISDLKIKKDYWHDVYLFYKKLKNDKDRDISKQLKEIDEFVEKQRKLSEIIENGFEQLSIKSPIAGNISSLDLILGQRLKPGDQIAIVDDLSSFYFESEINEYYLKKITYNSSANLVYNNGKTPLLVKLISSEVNNGTFKVRFELEDKKALDFKRGQSVDIIIKLDEDRKIFSVPSSMVFSIDNKSYVFIYHPDKKIAQRIQVSTGQDNGSDIEIKNGVTEGQTIVSFGKNRLVNNDTVRIE